MKTFSIFLLLFITYPVFASEERCRCSLHNNGSTLFVDGELREFFHIDQYGGHLATQDACLEVKQNTLECSLPQEPSYSVQSKNCVCRWDTNKSVLYYNKVLRIDPKYFDSAHVIGQFLKNDFKNHVELCDSLHTLMQKKQVCTK